MMSWAKPIKTARSPRSHSSINHGQEYSACSRTFNLSVRPALGVPQQYQLMDVTGQVLCSIFVNKSDDDNVNYVFSPHLLYHLQVSVSSRHSPHLDSFQWSFLPHCDADIFVPVGTVTLSLCRAVGTTGTARVKPPRHQRNL